MKKIFDTHSATDKYPKATSLEKIHHVAHYAFFWNFLEALFSQLLLILHQCLLFFKSTSILFGMQGTFLALIYGLVDIFNMSLELAIIPYFPYFNSSKCHFKTFIKHFILPQIIIFVCAPFLCYLFIYFCFQSIFSTHLRFFFTPQWIMLGALCIIFEGLKKNGRALLYLAFKNKTTATTEIIQIGSYILTIWGFYWYGFSLTMNLLFIPFALISMLTTLYIWIIIYKSYQFLPDTAEATLPYSFKIFTKQRFTIFINHSCRIFFSSNFLIPLFAQVKGFVQAGFAHLTSNIIFGFTYSIQKLFAPTGSALFTHVRSLDHSVAQSIFSSFIKKIFYTLVCLFSLTITTSVLLLKTTEKTVYITLIPLIIIFFLSHILESLFIIFEKLFIAYEQAHNITVCNIISLLFYVMLFYYLKPYSFILFIIASMLVRLITFCIICLISRQKWGFSYGLSFSKQSLRTLIILFSLFFCGLSIFILIF